MWLLSIAFALTFAAGFGYWRHLRKRHIIIHTSPEIFRYKVVHANSTDKGYLLLSPYRLNRWSDGQLLIMDTRGKVYFQKTISGAPFCFRQWNFGGRIFYSYLSDDRSVYHIPKIDLAAGKAVILDSAFHEIKRFGLLHPKELNGQGGEGLDLHDLIMLGSDHFITIAEIERKVDNLPADMKPSPGLKLAVPVIQEIIGDKLVWQWIASDHPELYASSVRGNRFSDSNAKHDYLHINSIVIDPTDSNYIVSFRHADQVVKIDRKSGAILWKIGGVNSDFKLAKDQLFYKQHSAVMTKEGEVMIFDNGDKISRERSRIVWFKLDEVSKKVISFRAYNLDEPFSMYMGSAETHGDTLLVAGGTANYLLELNIRTKEKIFELHSSMALYRVYRVASIAGLPQGQDQQCILSHEDTMMYHLNK